MFKKILLNKKAVAFDLDGTITNSKPYWDAAVKVVAEKYGIYEIDMSPLWPMIVTKKWETILLENKPNQTKTVAELTEETYTTFLDLCEKAELEYMDGLPETIALLKTEKKMKTILATNSIKKVADRMLEIMDIKFYFNDFVYREELKNIKPNPEIYVLAAKKLGVKTHEMLVFEDSPIGVEAAVKAGCDVIVIWNGLTSQDEYPNDSKVKTYISDFSTFWPNANIDIEEEVLLRVQRTAKIAKDTIVTTQK